MPVELKIPPVGESITEVVIGAWHKAVGESVARDEEVVELETDKATFELPAPVAGVLSQVLKQPGETAAVGDVIAVIGDTADMPSAALAATSRPPQVPGPKPGPVEPGPIPTPAWQAAPQHSAEAQTAQVGPASVVENAPESEAPSPPGTAPREKPGPVQPDRAAAAGRQKIAEETAATDGAGSSRSAGGSGRLTQAHHGRLPQREEKVIAMSPIRRRIADRLVEAQRNAALLTTFNEIDMSAVIGIRKKYRDAFPERYGVKLGFMSFFVKAVVEALSEAPQLNAEIRGSDVVYRNFFDIGIAVGGGKGLVVPILRNAERLSFAEIERAIADFALRAGANQLKVEELQGGTFTISNGGVYGSLMSTPIVNPPQSGVLGMHVIQDRPVVREGNIVIRPMMYVALTYDHRLVDGREAVTFLNRIREIVEDPARLLIEV